MDMMAYQKLTYDCVKYQKKKYEWKEVKILHVELHWKSTLMAIPKAVKNGHSFQNFNSHYITALLNL